MQRAFWDSLQEKLDEDPPDYSHALVLFQEVKEVCKLSDIKVLNLMKLKCLVARRLFKKENMFYQETSFSCTFFQ